MWTRPVMEAEKKSHYVCGGCVVVLVGLMESASEDFWMGIGIFVAGLVIIAVGLVPRKPAESES